MHGYRNTKFDLVTARIEGLWRKEWSRTVQNTNEYANVIQANSPDSDMGEIFAHAPADFTPRTH